MSSQKYYAEVLDAVPFSMTVDLMKRMLPSPLAYALAGWFRLRRLVGIPTKPRYGFGPVGSSTDLPRSQMPSRPMSRWAAKLERLADLGFRPVAFAVPDLIGAKEAASALFLDEAGTTFAVLEWQRLVGANGIQEVTPVEFDSYLADKSEVMTGLTAQEHLLFADAFKIDFVDQLFLADKISLKRGYEKHLQRIKDRQPIPCSLAAARDEHDRHSQLRFEAIMKLGLIRELSDREIAYVKQQKLPEK